MEIDWSITYIVRRLRTYTIDVHAILVNCPFNLHPGKWFEGYPVKSTLFFSGWLATWEKAGFHKVNQKKNGCHALEGVLAVQRSRQAQGTIICLFGLLFFSQNGMTLKKPIKIIKIQWKVTVFWNIIKVCSILAGKQRPKPIRWT